MVTPRDNREKIRNPEVMMNYNNTEYTFYTKDLYLKKKVPQTHIQISQNTCLKR